jgi:hypothetical protein
MLVMDQKVTTQDVLGELDARGVKFLTLRMRSPALTRYITSLTGSDFKTVTLERAGNFGQPAHTDRDTITVRLERRAYSPALRQARLPADTPVPWWGGRTLRFDYA